MTSELVAMTLTRIIEAKKIRAIVLEGYELTGNRLDRERRSEIARYVADRLDIEYSPRFRGRVRQAMEPLKLRTYRTDHVWRYRGIRKRT